MDHTRPELKYVNARELNGTAARLDGVPVVGSDGETLGKVEGFIIDVQLGAPRHVVVSAGWFIHKHFLLPIGHVNLTPDDTELRADIPKARVEGFPGFDKGEFETLSTDRADKLDQMIVAATGAGDPSDIEVYYRVPAGWDAGPRP
jgi:sporulation protein YlmC with PRC-barrel domain